MGLHWRLLLGDPCHADVPGLHSTPTPASFRWQATEPKRSQQGKPGGSTGLIHPVNPGEYTKQCPTPGPQPLHLTPTPGAGPIAGPAGLGWALTVALGTQPPPRHSRLPGCRRRPGWRERRVLSSLGFQSAFRRCPSLGLREPGLSEVSAPDGGFSVLPYLSPPIVGAFLCS